MKPELEFFPAETLGWTPALGGTVPGLWERVLAADQRVFGVGTRMLRFDPGADTTVAGPQSHPFWEEVYVLEGTLHDLTLKQQFRAGSYACRPPGMTHGPWRAPEGCVTFEVRYVTEPNLLRPTGGSAAELRFAIDGRDSRRSRTVVSVRELLVGAYTGRDVAGALEHIAELAALGVAAPARVPTAYAAPASLLTFADRIKVGSTRTSGEAEVALISSRRGLLVGLASDHTDRAWESIDIATSKLVCPRPLSRNVWLYEEVRDHWDELQLRSWVHEGSDRRLYQEGTLASLLTPADLFALLADLGHGDISASAMLGGTLPTVGGVTCGGRFEAELSDPILDRRLNLAYDIDVVSA